jgi:hypothetical protein
MPSFVTLCLRVIPIKKRLLASSRPGVFVDPRLCANLFCTPAHTKTQSHEVSSHDLG